jgi:hypothetical protein
MCYIITVFENSHLFYHPEKLIPLPSMQEMPGAEEPVFPRQIPLIMTRYHGSGWYGSIVPVISFHIRRRIMINPNGRRSGNERRSGNDRRLTSNVNLTNTCFLERRNFYGRRSLLNRRKGFVPVNQWRSVFLGVEIEDTISD